MMGSITAMVRLLLGPTSDLARFALGGMQLDHRVDDLRARGDVGMADNDGLVRDDGEGRVNIVATPDTCRKFVEVCLVVGSDIHLCKDFGELR
jgi:hypothetical protein